ncbi:MAG: hypothetical protein KDC62_08745 [Aequorivita sp.]|nr:hypothetical protein [Aequorivita sp.]
MGTISTNESNFDLKTRKPNKFVPLEINTELKNKISNWASNNVFYGLFPVVGDSMTCNNKKSIPEGSFIFAAEIKYNPNNLLPIPIKKPMAILINDRNGKEHLLCKTIFFLDEVFGRIGLRSYNHNHKDFFIPTSFIKRIFEIHEVYDRNMKAHNYFKVAL